LLEAVELPPGCLLFLFRPQHAGDGGDLAGQEVLPAGVLDPLALRQHFKVHDADRDRVPAKQLRRLQPPLARDQAVLAVDDHGVEEAHGLDGVRQGSDVAEVPALPLADDDLFDRSSLLHG